MLKNFIRNKAYKLRKNFTKLNKELKHMLQNLQGGKKLKFLWEKMFNKNLEKIFKF